MNETIHTEEAYGRAMAQVARAENDRLARVMSGDAPRMIGLPAS